MAARKTAMAERPAPARKTIRVVASSPKGGSGKTNLIRNLAVAAALEGFDVGTADFDPQQTLTKWLGKRPEQAASISHYAAGLPDVVDFLAEVDGHDLLFIDTPPSVEEHPEEIKALIAKADIVLIPSQTSADDTDSVAGWMRVVRSVGTPSAFVLNRVNRRTKSFLRARRRLVEAGALCPIEIPQYEAFVEAGELGLGVLEVKGAQGGDDVRTLWVHVRSQLGLEAPAAEEQAA